MSGSNIGINKPAAQGIPGPQGPAGADGLDGTDGDGFTGGSYNAVDGTVTFTSDDGLGFATGDLRGANGADGADGATGPQGPEGPQGPAGADGTNGTNGTNGTDGTGFTGGSYDSGTGIVTFTSDDGLGFSTTDLRGANGADGADGTNGTNGTNGTDGTGFTGGSYDAGTGVVTFTSDDGLGFATGDLRGADGADGAQGPAGETGPAGSDGLNGADGADGADGTVWREGTGAPSNATGVDGDFYLDDATGDVYQRAAGTYSVVANIKGATGAQGPAGADGTNGTNGTDGTDGLGFTGGSYDAGTGVVTFTSDDGLGFATGDLRGADGADGATGPAGPAGSNGTGLMVNEADTLTAALTYNASGTAYHSWTNTVTDGATLGANDTWTVGAAANGTTVTVRLKVPLYHSGSVATKLANFRIYKNGTEVSQHRYHIVYESMASGTGSKRSAVIEYTDSVAAATNDTWQIRGFSSTLIADTDATYSLIFCKHSDCLANEARQSSGPLFNATGDSYSTFSQTVDGDGASLGTNHTWTVAADGADKHAEVGVNLDIYANGTGDMGGYVEFYKNGVAQTDYRQYYYFENVVSGSTYRRMWSASWLDTTAAADGDTYQARIFTTTTVTTRAGIYTRLELNLH